MTAPILADPERSNPRLARVPLGRVAQPSEIADVVLFLCSEQASYLTGQNIAVDGGGTISTLLAPMPPAHRTTRQDGPHRPEAGVALA